MLYFKNTISPRMVSRFYIQALKIVMAAILGSAVFATCGAEADKPGISMGDIIMTMTLTSASFAQNGAIPRRYTCDGEDISPPLAWATPPAGTKSLALIVDDPDAPDPAAPKLTWVHWVLYNIPPATTVLPEAVSAKNLPAGTMQGLNDWKRTGYGGPCPPIGRHRYFHKLYALDSVLPDLGTPTKSALEKAMQGHILARVELIGTYQH
jgi:Raf kinase inhibitor-like YbhB/YbcL family protein